MNTGFLPLIRLFLLLVDDDSILDVGVELLQNLFQPLIMLLDAENQARDLKPGAGPLSGVESQEIVWL